MKCFREGRGRLKHRIKGFLHFFLSKKILNGENNEIETDGSQVFVFCFFFLKCRQIEEGEVWQKYVWGLAKLKTFEKWYETLEKH